jgi:hypothetical protein
MICMKATAVPFQIARSALAELLLAQVPAYIVPSSMSTARYARPPCDLLGGVEPSGERRSASSLRCASRPLGMDADDVVVFDLGTDISSLPANGYSAVPAIPRENRICSTGLHNIPTALRNISRGYGLRRRQKSPANNSKK